MRRAYPSMRYLDKLDSYSGRTEFLLSRANPRAASLAANFRDAPREMLEIAGLAEVLIDAGEADIGHAVELLQPVHHHFAHARGIDLAVAAGLQLALDRGDQPF